MKHKRKGTLIICYIVPPNLAIGGKRWFHLMNEMAKNENIYLITTTKNPLFPKLENISNVSSDFFQFLHKIPSSIFDKVFYKIQLFITKILIKGSPYDKGVLKKRSLIKKVKSLINQFQIDRIIVSGAPFSWCFFLAELKSRSKKFPKLYIDFRDPWTWGNSYGMNTISKKRYKYEKFKESFTIKNADLITVPSISMKNYLSKNYKDIDVLHLPHGFDKPKIISSLGKKEKSKILRFIYAGTWYENIDQNFNKFVLNLNNSELEYKIDIFTNSSFNVNITNNEKLTVSRYVNEKKMFQNIQNSDFYLLVFPDKYCNFLSAKLFEICFIGTPILYIGKSGELSHFIESNEFGVHFHPFEIESIPKSLHRFKNLKPNYKILDFYSFDNLVKLLN